MVQIKLMSTYSEIALTWMPQDFTDDESTLVQIMAWCHQATSHYLSQCWPCCMSPFGITRPQWVHVLNLFWKYKSNFEVSAISFIFFRNHPQSNQWSGYLCRHFSRTGQEDAPCCHVECWGHTPTQTEDLKGQGQCQGPHCLPKWPSSEHSTQWPTGDIQVSYSTFCIYGLGARLCFQQC